jgi:ABC-2 type transport system permease protein
LATSVINRDLTGPLTRLRAARRRSTSSRHQHYNPESISQYNIVPGLMGVMLTMTHDHHHRPGHHARTRARHDGKPALHAGASGRGHPRQDRALHLVGYVQVFLVLVAAKFLFDVPFVGSVPLLTALTFFFIVANLAVGITFSTIAKNQLQAVQMAFFFFLPSLLLSGYMFPFRGMPGWAQDIGECLPLTHFLRIVRGILLKGNGLAEMCAGPVADCAVSGRHAGHRHQALQANIGLNGGFMVVIR